MKKKKLIGSFFFSLIKKNEKNAKKVLTLISGYGKLYLLGNDNNFDIIVDYNIYSLEYLLYVWTQIFILIEFILLVLCKLIDFNLLGI